MLRLSTRMEFFFFFFEQEFLLCVNVEIAVSLLGLLQPKLVLILWFKPIIIIR